MLASNRTSVHEASLVTFQMSSAVLCLIQLCVLHSLLGAFAHVSVMYGFEYKSNVGQEPLKAAGALICRVQYFFPFSGFQAFVYSPTLYKRTQIG